MYSNRRQPTQSDVDAYRDRTRKAFEGQPFEIESNGHGLRAECMICCESNTTAPEMWMHEHACPAEVIAELVEVIEYLTA